MQNCKKRQVRDTLVGSGLNALRTAHNGMNYKSRKVIKEAVVSLDDKGFHVEFFRHGYAASQRAETLSKVKHFAMAVGVSTKKRL